MKDYLFFRFSPLLILHTKERCILDLVLHMFFAIPVSGYDLMKLLNNLFMALCQAISSNATAEPH